MKTPLKVNRFFSIFILACALYAPVHAAGAAYEALKNSSDRSLEKVIISLARVSLTTYLETGKRPLITFKVPEVLQKQGGAFVSLIRKGKTVGCMGTLTPTQPTVAQEIMRSAILAATQDGRHRCVRLSDMKDIRFYVSIPGPLTRVSSESQLNPMKLGLLVRKGSRYALLLPGEAKTARYQVEECMRKAGIPSGAHVEMFTFPTVAYGPG
jgi:uncharacterized protein (TIGR00296 family)